MRSETKEAEIKLSIASSALLIAGFVAASTENASAVVYCQYFEYPAGCVVRPSVVIAPPSHDVRKIPPPIDARTRGFITGMRTRICCLTIELETIPSSRP
jgi:hypothetical protein